MHVIQKNCKKKIKKTERDKTLATLGCSFFLQTSPKENADAHRKTNRSINKE